ncbi:hypothetical protein HMPREF6485_1787 [Segatella buccae ATCC 33574]|uniref:Uncharacterized protein n=1 Tax=Segatella buccae ATCC 33574 TaxID=873513 RepID=E6K7E1_9BACT|nr:hypothetical protein HMPREF6485_1787 [Segatella buccae ATCC 33574]
MSNILLVLIRNRFRKIICKYNLKWIIFQIIYVVLQKRRSTKLKNEKR